DANNYEGTKISGTLYPNVKNPGTFGGKFLAMNYVMTVYGMWYSASLFQQNDWTPPQTWDEAIALGAKAKAKGKYLLVWGKDATKSGFEMPGTQEPAVAASPTTPPASARAAAGEPYIVPSQANNVAGGKEILRAMLSKAAATNFSNTRLAPTIVKGLVPADGFGSTALVSQTKMLDAAGTNTFNYQFVDYYGMNTDQLVVWNSFLSGQTDVPGL